MHREGKSFTQAECVEEFEYIKETDSNHSGIFMLSDGNMIYQILENDEAYIYEKITFFQLLDYLTGTNNAQQ